MAKTTATVRVHVITAKVTGSDGKTYDGSIAYGADSWAAMDEEYRNKMGEEAARVVAHRHAEDSGTEVVGEIEIVGHTDEEFEIETEIVQT